MNKIFECILPIRLVSEANNFDHWTSKKIRKDKIKLLIKQAMEGVKIPLPCLVKLIRIAPREYDSDNMQYNCKTLRDAIGDQIIPGLRMGRADANKALQFNYEQRKGPPKTYQVIIEIYLDQNP
jgi:hypothetical protein